MTSRLRFRNLDIDPSAPVEDWPEEGIQAALERGSISDYRRVAAATSPRVRVTSPQDVHRAARPLYWPSLPSVAVSAGLG